ncbi:hypothetical protein D9M70_584660 [compost metagenome]
MPGHADEERAVVAEVGRPPILRIGHQREEVILHRWQIKLFEFLGIVEGFAHRVGKGGILVQDLQVELVRPPVTVRGTGGLSARLSSVHDGTFARFVGFRVHFYLPLR